jgi:hypothetical protein
MRKIRFPQPGQVISSTLVTDLRLCSASKTKKRTKKGKYLHLLVGRIAFSSFLLSLSYFLPSP